ncbi:MAG: apolipoprotein N-acyltransferase [Thermodesulfobacteriota bacterium]
MGAAGGEESADGGKMKKGTAIGPLDLRQLILILCSVVLLFVGMPGSGSCWWLLFIALVPFFLAIGQGTRRQAVWAGLLLGVCHFLALLYWLVNVLGHYGGLPLYVAVPALFLLALYMSLYTVAKGLFYYSLLHRGAALGLVWSMALFWVGLDWVRSVLFSGFPWMDLGYGLGGQPALIQSGDLWGHHGLTFLVVMVNVVIALLLDNRFRPQRPLLVIGPVASLLVVVGLYSSLQMNRFENQLNKVPSMTVGVVQGNIAQDQKWTPAMREKTVNRYIRLSRELGRQKKLDLLVWPETALPFYPSSNPLMAPLYGFVNNDQINLLSGSPWYEFVDSKSEKPLFYNSAILVEPVSRISGRVSKSHLVPFGEYVPLKKILFFLGPLVEAVGDFTPGTIEKALACHRARIGVLICFESIFPSISRQWAQKGATLLVNLTNDAWYGRTSAPHHSLAMSTLRAVETRRSLVRAANTGFSGFIDPLGRVRALSPLFEQWAKDDSVPLMSGKSPYVRGGYLFAPAALIISLLLLLLRKRLWGG